MSAREDILAKLKKADALPVEEPPTFDYYREMGASWADDVGHLEHWVAAMRAVKTEIYWVTKTNWPQVFRQAAGGKGLKNTLLPLEAGHGRLARAALTGAGIEPRDFERKIDDWKNEFFADIEARFSGSKYGIARIGTIILKPSPLESRSLSLIPFVHFCLFDANKMYNEFHNAIGGEKLIEEGMPTNVILISGPSRTADIQLTLVYGTHSPRDLMTLAVLSDHISPAILEERA